MNPLFPSEENIGINTDLYELTMSAVYFQSGRAHEKATFELFARQLPPCRNFLIAAGLEQALHFISNIRFSKGALHYLHSHPIFQNVDDGFFQYLRDFCFTGDVWALPEGTPFFGNEPVLQVQAPVIEAQILETFLINMINFQTTVASKAARLVLAAEGRGVVDFGSRRAHGPQAAVLAARAAFLAGCEGTSNVWAGFELGVPIYGTMAHSFVQFFEDELQAFQSFRDVFPRNSILLVDTYDTLEGIQTALKVQGGFQGVRLDSGDLADLAHKTRRILREQGRDDVRIVASGNLDEEKLQALHRADAPIDSYGVGTDLVVSVDAPGCDMIYKLVEITRGGESLPSLKASEGKATVPYRKQIFRSTEERVFNADLIARWDEEPDHWQKPLLQKYMENGKLLAELPDLQESRAYTRRQLEQLPLPLKRLDGKREYPVRFSSRLLQVQEKLGGANL